MEPRTVQYKSSFPVIVTPHLRQARDFYVEHFGFHPVFEADWYVQLHAPGEGGGKPIELAFMKPDQRDQPSELHHAFNGVGVVFTFEVADPDSLYQRVRDAGCTTIVELKDEPWGQRHFLVRDPIGNLVDVVKQIPPSRDYEKAYSRTPPGLTEHDVDIQIVLFDPRFADQCAALLATVPEWFGIPESNASYLRNLGILPSWVAVSEGQVLGAITLEEHFPASYEVHFMAVRRDHHRRGIGRALLSHVEKEARSRGARWLHVKTLAPSDPDENYARTRAFYQALGFSLLFASDALFGDPGNPAVVLVKAI
jgi:catechol 2,3-dioxygenase-like lactoylglutathione lyase family enzyme